jgi:hypothetical protein
VTTGRLREWSTLSVDHRHLGERMSQPDYAVSYIDRTRELYSGQAPYRWVVNDRQADPPPWTPITKPLSSMRVALIGSGGVHLDDQEPFHFHNDTSIREVPLTQPLSS